MVFEISIHWTDQDPKRPRNGPEEIYPLETGLHKNEKPLQHNALKMVGLLGFEPRTKRL